MNCETWIMTLRSSDLQSDSDLDSIRNSCDVYNTQLQFWQSLRCWRYRCRWSRWFWWFLYFVVFGLVFLLSILLFRLVIFFFSCFVVILSLFCGFDVLGLGSNNKNGNLKWFLPWRGGGSQVPHIATYLFWKRFFKNHLESFPDCENVFCT